MEKKYEKYEKPTVRDYGTLVEITAACDTPGAGDFKFPDTLHNTFLINSQGICQST